MFARDPLDLGARKKEICATHGLEGVFPMELVQLDLAAPRPDQGLAIYDVMESAMRACDGMIANITPYHGPSADVGSAYDMGFMRALGRPVFAYSNDPRLFAVRAAVFFGEGRLRLRPNGEREAPDGMALEEFDLIDNLMLVGGALRSGGAIATEVAPEGALYTELRAFETSVRQAAAWFAVNPLG